MPDWESYEQRYREWYMRHKKQIYVAAASSFILMLIAGILVFTDLISAELFAVMLLGSFLCMMVFLFLIMVGEERYPSGVSTPIPTP